jgi:hypothetical protein
MMHGPEKSDSVIVAEKPTNKAERSAAELVEQRAGTKGNAGQLSTRRTLSRISVTQVLARIRQQLSSTLGGSRMRESRTCGSVRGARGNSRPYREYSRRCTGLQPLLARRRNHRGRCQCLLSKVRPTRFARRETFGLWATSRLVIAAPPDLFDHLVGTP